MSTGVAALAASMRWRAADQCSNAARLPPAAVHPARPHVHSQQASPLCCTSNLLASASSDGTARIWDLEETGSSGSGRVCVCRHAPQGGAASAELTCVEWAPDGQLLATGATDNAVRLFSREGEFLVGELFSREGQFLVGELFSREGQFLVGELFPGWSCSLGRGAGRRGGCGAAGKPGSCFRRHRACGQRRPGCCGRGGRGSQAWQIGGCSDA